MLKISCGSDYDFVQISPACGTITFWEMYGDTLDFQFQLSKGKTEKF